MGHALGAFHHGVLGNDFLLLANLDLSSSFQYLEGYVHRGDVLLEGLPRLKGQVGYEGVIMIINCLGLHSVGIWLGGSTGYGLYLHRASIDRRRIYCFCHLIGGRRGIGKVDTPACSFV